MRVTLDPQQMRDCMELWRHVLTIRTGDDGAHDSGAERAKRLTSLSGTLAGWLDLLRMCTADGRDSEALQQISDEVALFKAWTEEARLALALLQDAQRVKPRVAARRKALR